MSEYKGIKGFQVQTRTVDPSDPIPGDFYYNSTEGKFKTVITGGAPLGSWASAPALNTARFGLGGAGVQTAALAFGGGGGGSPANQAQTEYYNGTSWTELNDLNQGRYFSAKTSFGTVYTAALAVTGYNYVPPAQNIANVESWNGSSWTEVNDVNSARRGAGAGGTSTSGIIGGGYTTTITNVAETWDGSSWTEVSELNTGREDTGGVGTSSSAMQMHGGYTGSQSGATEQWNGSSWTEVNDMNTARSGAAGSGTPALALAVGGEPGPTAKTEAWDGTSWTEVGDLATARTKGASSATSSSASIFFGGSAPPNTTATELWTTAGPTSTILVEGDAFLSGGTGFKGVVKASSPATVWSSGGNTNTDRAYGWSFGSQTAAQIAGGQAPPGEPNSAKSEQYNGTSWTEVGDLNYSGAAEANAGSGTQTDAVVAAFTPSTYDLIAEKWNGSSWSEVAELNTEAKSRGSSSTSGPAAVVFGGTPATANTETFDGTSWSEVNNLNASKYASQGVGSPTSAMSIGGYEPGGYTVNVESWNGTSWSEGTNVNSAQGYGGAAGASSSNAVKFGGSGGPTGFSAITELWNGSSWTEIGNLSSVYTGNIGAGSSASALNIPGKSNPSTYPGACEEFTGSLTLQTITVS